MKYSDIDYIWFFVPPISSTELFPKVYLALDIWYCFHISKERHGHANASDAKLCFYLKHFSLIVHCPLIVRENAEIGYANGQGK